MEAQRTAERMPAPDEAAQVAQRLVANVGRVLEGKREVVELAVTSLLARGHLLVEDVPGVGKTTLARALARSLGLTFRRIQFTSDLMPADVLGGNVYAQQTGDFKFRRGPIFTHILLADEINRTTPKTQSALLEAMDERQVSLDGQTYPLDEPFFVVATQNPEEFYGTYPLPESQLDRFLMRVRIGYPPQDVERQVIGRRRAIDPVDALEPVVRQDELLAAQRAVDDVRASAELVDYLHALILRDAYLTAVVDRRVDTRRARIGARDSCLRARTRSRLRDPGRREGHRSRGLGTPDAPERGSQRHGRTRGYRPRRTRSAGRPPGPGVNAAPAAASKKTGKREPAWHPADAAELRQYRSRFWRLYRSTREGRAFLATTLGVGLAAVNTGNNLLFLVFGFMMSLIVLSGVMNNIVLRGVRVERSLPERAFAGTTCLVEVKVRNTKTRMPSYSIEVEDLAEGPPSGRRCYFLKVAAGGHEVASYRRVPERRGPLALHGFRVATRYPFGIGEKWRLFQAPDEMLVFPALLSDELVAPDLSSLGHDSPTPKPGPGTEIAGLKAYQEGDEARSIHWRRSAALGRLVVHEKQRDASTHITIVLDNLRPTAAPPAWADAFERAISRAAALSVMVVGRDLSAEIVCRGTRSPVVLPGASADPILRFLALLDSVPEADAPPLDAAAASSRVLRVPVATVRSAA